MPGTSSGNLCSFVLNSLYLVILRCFLKIFTMSGLGTAVCVVTYFYRLSFEGTVWSYTMSSIRTSVQFFFWYLAILSLVTVRFKVIPCQKWGHLQEVCAVFIVTYYYLVIWRYGLQSWYLVILRCYFKIYTMSGSDWGPL